MAELALAIDPFTAAPAAMEALDRLELQVRSADSFEQVADLADQAAGLQRRFKPVKGVADRAGEMWIAAETRIGQELAKLPKARGTRGQIKKGAGRVKGGAKLEPPITDAPTLAQLKVTRKRAARARKLVELPEADRQALIAELKAEDKEITPDAVLRKQRQHTKQDKKFETARALMSWPACLPSAVMPSSAGRRKRARPRRKHSRRAHGKCGWTARAIVKLGRH